MITSFSGALSVTLTAVLMTSGVMTQTTTTHAPTTQTTLASTTRTTLAPSYNVAQLKTCARLGQQLRDELNGMFTSLTDRVTNAQALPDAKNALVKKMLEDATISLAEGWEALFEVGNAIGIHYTQTMKAIKSTTYASPMPLYSTVKFDHSLGYNNDTGKAVFKKSGVYLIEFKSQSNYYGSSTTKFQVYTSADVQKYAFELFTDWEVSPYFEMVKVDVGDYLKISSNTQSVMTGIASQFMVTFLGDFVPLGYQTTAPPPPPTTACTGWYCYK